MTILQNPTPMEGFLKYSPDGRMVKVVNPPKVPKFAVGLLKAYTTEQEVVDKDRAFTFSRHILPMPMSVSPVYVALRGDVPARATVNSVDQFLIIRHIYMCYCCNPHRHDYNVKTVETHDKFVADREERLFKDLDHLMKAYRAEELNQRQALESLLPMLGAFTVDLINYMELAIMETLVFKAPLTEFKTGTVDILSLDEQERKYFFETMRYFFGAKQDLRNAWMQQTNDDYKPVQFFGVDQFEERLTNTPPGEVYCGFIDLTTSMEYFKFLDFDQILTTV